MRIDAVIVLVVGAILYLQIMIDLYDNVVVALVVFVVSGSFGIWMGLAFAEAPEGSHPNRSG